MTIVNVQYLPDWLFIVFCCRAESLPVVLDAFILPVFNNNENPSLFSSSSSFFIAPELSSCSSMERKKTFFTLRCNLVVFVVFFFSSPCFFSPFQHKKPFALTSRSPEENDPQFKHIRLFLLSHRRRRCYYDKTYVSEEEKDCRIRPQKDLPFHLERNINKVYRSDFSPSLSSLFLTNIN